MSEQIYGFTYRWLPSSQPEISPTLLLLHGTGGNENDLLELGRELAPQANLLSPRGKVLEGTMPRFFRRLAEGVFDLKDLQFRTHELADFVSEAARKYGFTEKSLIAVGYSNGANVAASMLLLRPKVLRAAVLFRGMVPLVPEDEPDLSKIKVLLSSGRYDPIVSVDNAEQLAAMLAKYGADLTLSWQETHHSLSLQDVLTAKTWLISSNLIGMNKDEVSS
jgi:predicted esterase